MTEMLVMKYYAIATHDLITDIMLNIVSCY